MDYSHGSRWENVNNAIDNTMGCAQAKGNTKKSKLDMQECAAREMVPRMPAIPAAISIDHHCPIVDIIPAVDSFASRPHCSNDSFDQPPQHSVRPVVGDLAKFRTLAKDSLR